MELECRIERRGRTRRALPSAQSLLALLGRASPHDAATEIGGGCGHFASVPCRHDRGRPRLDGARSCDLILRAERPS